MTPRDEPGDAFESGQGPHREFSLPPVDTGKDAWLFLAACFVIEALVWGFPFSFGIFQKYYSSHEPFKGSGNIAIIGTCTSGIMYLSGLPALVLNRMYPRLGRWSPMVGLLIMCLSLALSSFATTVTQLIATQGVLYAVGGSIGYLPCILYMDEWFVRRKGLAYGIMWSGTGLAGVILPLLLEYLLSAYGHQTTLCVWACALFALTAPLAYFIKPRLPPSPVTHPRSFNLRFAMSTPFMLYQLANVVEAIGFFLPGIHLPSYAADALKAGPFPSALTALLVVCGARIPHRLSVCYDVYTCLHHRRGYVPAVGFCSQTPRAVHLLYSVRHHCRVLHDDVDGNHEGGVVEVQC
ncbi:hypothetical protein FJTKL_10270 [Diaporthe vaccinii]|uniref:Uncharacterized protein n=1 Tax=Diaporthe vaccinii TaxID=105482 RepID=A0ABR4EKN1_9PEZI